MVSHDVEQEVKQGETHLNAGDLNIDFNCQLSTVDCQLPPVDIFVTGWNRSLSRSPEIEVRSVPPMSRDTPRIFSLPVHQRGRVEAKSWFFVPPPEEWKKPEEDTAAQEHGGPQASTQNAADLSAQSCECEESFPEPFGKPTRIPVPRDVIKLADKLGYILQPPLEAILRLPSLEMPFAPFPYQRQGVAFLYGAQFAILADEMGLGKTMQAITSIRLLLRTGELRSVLLVCPKPLVTNWQREFSLWAPELNVQVIEGNPQRRRWCWRELDAPVRIANYELLARDREFYDGPPSSGAPLFDLVVLDESQRIKNQSNATSRAAQAIPRRRNWALTGTPVENSQEDLVGIFEFLSPGFVQSGLKPSEVAGVVGEHILRRTKDQVLTDLPPKMMRDAQIELTGSQWTTYEQAEKEGTLRLSEMGEGISISNVFELVMRLKQICNYDPLTGESAKLERLLADIEEVAQSGRKAIVFSQWVETLLFLKTHLLPYNPVEYHGKIPSNRRDGVIGQFRDDPSCHVILMSYGAGSVGLNLQFAGYVFLFDRWWNPAVEDQAINRAHRIGAAGPVTVTRFISANTVEERIDRILQEKRDLAESVLSGARGLNHSVGMSQDEIFGLFNLRKPMLVKKTA